MISVKLHLVFCVCEQVSVAEMMVECGASMDIPDIEGRTPLHVAAWQGIPDCLFDPRFCLCIKIGFMWFRKDKKNVDAIPGFDINIIPVLCFGQQRGDMLV